MTKPPSRLSKWRWSMSLVLGFLFGLILVLFIVPKKQAHFPRWPERTSTLSSFSSPERVRASPEAHAGHGVGEPAPSRAFLGRLLDALSAGPVADGVVSLHADPESAVRSDREGFFSLAVSGELPVVILIQAEGYPAAHLNLTEVPNSRADILLHREIAFSVLLSDDVTFAPVHGATVTVESGTQSGRALTNHSGLAGPLVVAPMLEIKQGLGAAASSRLSAVRLVADAPGYQQLQTYLDPSGESTKVLLRLRALKTVSGRVLDQHGAPVPGATVVAEWFAHAGKDTTHHDFTRTVSGEQGRFRLEVLHGRAGELYVGAAKNGLGPAAAHLDLADEGPEPELTLTLPPEHRLLGQVTDRTGKPLAGVQVSLHGEPLARIPGALRTELGEAYDAPIGMTASEEDGYFVAPGLLPGSYQLRVFDANYTFPKELTVSIPYPGDLELTLEPGGSLAGLVMDPENGTPVRTATVIASLPGGKEDERSFQVNSDGEFLITGLLSGRHYNLTAAAKGYRHQNVRKLAPGTRDVVVELEPLPKDLPGKAGKLRLQIHSGGYLVHDHHAYFLIGIFDAQGNRHGSYRRRSAINGAIVIEDVPEGRASVAIASDRYAPVVLDEVLIGPENPPIQVEIRPGCAIFGEEFPAESLPPRAFLELRGRNQLVPISLIHRSPTGWRLGVVEEGETYTLTITDQGTPLGTLEFIARCGDPVQLRLSSAPR